MSKDLQQDEDDRILLKVHREFSTNEAMQSLFKIISSLEFEIGELKSERDELLFKLKEARTEGFATKKQWLKDELVAELHTQIKNHQKRNTEVNKSMNDWRNRYFSIAAQHGLLKQN
jgi:flagellar biosynthesis chaperone FliJ